jgi:hypothetical protein
MYPNWDFWFENKPSGNPGRESMFSFFECECDDVAVSSHIAASAKQEKNRYNRTTWPILFDGGPAVAGGGPVKIANVYVHGLWHTKQFLFRGTAALRTKFWLLENKL